MNPLFLITKGIKARKKRLLGGGQGGGGGLLGTKLLVGGTKSPSNLSSARISIFDGVASNYINDSITGALIRRATVDDYVANLNGLFYENGANGNSNILDAGITTLNSVSVTDYNVIIEGIIDPNSGSTSNEFLNVSVIKNTVNANIVFNQQTGLIRWLSFNATHRHGRVDLTISPNSNYNAGEIIIKVNITGGGTDTDANVIAGTAQTSDAYYLKIIMT
jgi:hypothetical protein